MLSVQAGEADLAFRPMPIFAVKPGKLRDCQFGALPGKRDKADFAVAQIEVIELAQEQIADAVGLEAFTLVVAA